MSKSKAIRTINNHLKLFNNDPVCGVSLNVNEKNIFEWELLIQGPADTLYEGGLFKAKLNFPTDFPFNPPVFKFITPVYHPNIYPDGKVCISILHPPGDDKFGYEDGR